ncbi:MAG: dihydroorotase, partial [Prevotella sp.]|nr:dihydroorotase [Prevotella sp.]
HAHCDQTVDATGCFVLPGIIDTHVHFREPGLTAKADIESESRAAAYGGVTSFFDMPNTVPQTTTLEALDEKFTLARQKSHINYSFFFGATNDNADLFPQLDAHRLPGIKLFMGSSTGNMLVDRQEALMQIFEQAPLPVVAHCEDTAIINRNVQQALSATTAGSNGPAATESTPSGSVSSGSAAAKPDLPIALHQLIRSEEACYASSLLAVSLAKTFGTRLHVAHVSTARELELFGEFSNITAEAVVAHLLFTNRDYQRLGALIKCNPSIKAPADRDALRQALTDGRITTVGTDHAPHLLSDKQGGALKATSGMPMIQFSLVSMLGLVDEGVLTLERLAELMCHNPARLFEVRDRGFLRPGYKADITIVRPNAPWTLTEDLIQSKCHWSPLTGTQFNWRVEHTFCNGLPVYQQGRFNDTVRGEEISFR